MSRDIGPQNRHRLTLSRKMPSDRSEFRKPDRMAQALELEYADTVQLMLLLETLPKESPTATAE